MGASPTPTAFVDMVESVGVVTGTREGGHVDVTPVSEDVRHLLRVAAGNELAYELPLRLLGDLCVFSVDGIPSGGPVRVAIEEGIPRAYDTLSLTSPSMCGNHAYFGRLSHTQRGRPQSIWLFLGASLSMSPTSPDVLVRHLEGAAKWATAGRSPKVSALLYMSGHPLPLIGNPGASANTTVQQTAKGPSYLVYLSPCTYRTLVERIGGLLPFECAWRVLLPNLRLAWSVGNTSKVVAMLAALRDSAVQTGLKSKGADLAQVVNEYRRVLHVLLSTPGCTRASLLYLIQLNSNIDELVGFSSAVVTDGTCFPLLVGDNVLTPTHFNCTNNTYTTYNMPLSTSRLLLVWYRFVGHSTCDLHSALKTNHPLSPVLLQEFGYSGTHESRARISYEFGCDLQASLKRAKCTITPPPFRTHISFSSVISLYLLMFAIRALCRRRRAQGMQPNNYENGLSPGIYYHVAQYLR